MLAYVKSLSHKVLVLVFAASIVSACATGPAIDEASLTPEQRQMRQEARAFQKTLWQGVAAGAALGALTGAITGLIEKETSDKKKKGQVRKRAAQGAVAGAVAGGIAGLYIADKQKKYAREELVLESMIDDVRQKNAEAEQLVATMETVVEEDRRKLARLEQQYREGLVQDAEYRRQINIIDNDKKVIAESIEKAEEQLAVFKDARTEYAAQNPNADLSEYDSEIAALEQQIAAMTDISARLAA